MTEQRRPKVLVLAESANPHWSSASLIGWSLSQALRTVADVHVVTHPRNSADLQAAGWVEGRDFTAVDPARVERPVTRFGEGVRKVTRLGWTWTTAFSTFSYYYFEPLVWQRFGEALRRREFDVVHRITPVSPATPSVIAPRCRRIGVPFVWGPMNGGVPWPKEFRSALRREGEWLSYVRGARKLLPGYGATRRSAAALVAGSTYVWDDLGPYRSRVVYLPENAIEPERFAGLSGPGPGNGTGPTSAERHGPLRAAFVGRLVSLKGVDMLLEAAAELVRSGQLVLDIIGDGPEMPRCREIIARERMDSGVLLPGWIDQRDVLKRLGQAQVFTFPSIREFGGGVVLEAMALGLAPVVIRYGGPAELVTDDTGIRVPMGSRESIVQALKTILEELVASPNRVRRLGEAARERVYRLFTWEVKARQISEIYRWVLGEGARPDFGMPLSR